MGYVSSLEGICFFLLSWNLTLVAGQPTPKRNKRFDKAGLISGEGTLGGWLMPVLTTFRDYTAQRCCKCFLLRQPKWRCCKCGTLEFSQGPGHGGH